MTEEIYAVDNTWPRVAVSFRVDAGGAAGLDLWVGDKLHGRVFSPDDITQWLWSEQTREAWRAAFLAWGAGRGAAHAPSHTVEDRHPLPIQSGAAAA